MVGSFGELAGIQSVSAIDPFYPAPDGPVQSRDFRRLGESSGEGATSSVCASTPRSESAGSAKLGAVIRTELDHDAESTRGRQLMPRSVVRVSVPRPWANLYTWWAKTVRPSTSTSIVS